MNNAMNFVDSSRSSRYKDRFHFCSDSKGKYDMHGGRFENMGNHPEHTGWRKH